MSSEFPDSFTHPGGDDDSALSTGWTRPFEDDDDGGGGGDDSDYDSVPHDSESRRDYNLDSPIFRGSTGVTSVPLGQYPPSAYGEPISKRPDGSDSATDSQSRIINGSGEQVPFAQYPSSAYGEPLTKGSDGSDGPILPPPSEMEREREREEGFALREWRRENAIRLQEKEKREKELLNQIIEEADEYKLEFYHKIKIASENNKASNREKQKLFLANQEKFHAEANKNYWKSIAELIPNEVPTIEKKRGKKDQEKKPSVVVIQGPKPGKPTDLSRMRQILVKLKHNTPAHLKHAPPPPPAPASDAKSTAASAAVGTAAAAPPKAVAVA